jgi:large subunit ribosomal protein L21
MSETKKTKTEPYAVVDIGTKQFMVKKGDVLDVDKLDGKVGDKIDCKVLFKDGQPAEGGASIKAEILSHGKGKKIIVFKFKPKSNYRRKQGHRQQLTKLKIVSL